jgi:hypothetical protein
MVLLQTDAAQVLVCRRLAIGGCLAAVLGAKLWLIARLGNPTPYWDQWDAEAAGLYLPYLSQSLSFANWVAFHNEHRLLLTRATALALMLLSGSWDTILQMLFNALLHLSAIGFLLIVIGRVLNRTALMFFLVFALIFLAVPFGWDNTLGGFQMQFYFLILLGPVSLFMICHARAWSPWWLLGTLLGAAGYFSIASGALILPAAVILAVVQFALGRRTGPRELVGIAVHAVISIILLHDLLSYAPHVGTGGNSIGQMFSSIMISASWPIAAGSWPVVLRVIPAALVYGPILLLGALLLKQRPSIADRRWFYLALAAWLALQVFALSFGRAGGTVQSRYADIFVIGLLINCAALLYLIFAEPFGPKYRKLLFSGAAVWLLAVMLGAGQKATNNIVDDLSFRHSTGQMQTENVKNFLMTGDFAHLDNKPKLQIPHFSAERLRELLSQPALRAILPAALTGAAEQRGVKAAILSQGPMLIPLGLALMMMAALAAYLLPREGERP